MHLTNVRYGSGEWRWNWSRPPDSSAERLQFQDCAQLLSTVVF
ncbi:hypothetical protein M8C21_029060 [Ambrosia artemisiifolia]|uniref:Uncharacterized protein n=1 Tax=Ambrosia artemisiifolia TaxID=4212 RepID=A0AAD5GP03_AMBAR|nr:hypothetical protein M8C21_029060 [Ambrosia artemisiifolia]